MSDTNQRMVYGNTLVELGRQDQRIVVLDADLGGSTMGKLFEAEFPERHFEMGIAEANMTSVAAGLAQTGKSRSQIHLPYLQAAVPMTRYARPLQLEN